MNVKNLVLGIGIIVVFGLTLWQGIGAFYPLPKYENYCDDSSYYQTRFPKEQVSCVDYPQLKEEEKQCFSTKGRPIYEYDDNNCPVSVKLCDYCNLEFEEAQKEHSKFVFFISLAAGILALVVGYAILSVEPVGSALMGSGIWAFFYGTVINWRNISNIWRFLLLLLALILIIWIALRLNKQSERNKLIFADNKKS